MSKGLIIGGVLFLMLIVIGVIVYFMMGGSEEPEAEPKVEPEAEPKAEPKVEPEAAAVPKKKDPPVENDQAWRDNNPGAVIATFSPSCGTAKTFNPSVKYKGPSGDNYYNYCHEMVLSQTPSCKVEFCKNKNVYGACKDECNKKEASPTAVNNQAWRDNNPGAVIATVSPSCATPKTFNPNVKYKGPSGDNYYNYCHEMVLSQTSSCKVELCKNENVYGACKNECNKK